MKEIIPMTDHPTNTPPLAAVLAAFGEAMSLAADGQALPPGLDLRVTPRFIEVLSHGRIVATIDRSTLLERAAEIGSELN